MAGEGNDPWLVMLCNLPVFGDFIAMVVGLWPLGLFCWLLSDSPGLALVLGGLVLAPWLIFLERSQHVRMNVPFLPIKWLWLTPVVLLGGFAILFGA